MPQPAMSKPCLSHVSAICQMFARYYYTDSFNDFDCIGGANNTDHDAKPPKESDDQSTLGTELGHDFEIEHVLLDALHARGYITLHPLES